MIFFASLGFSCLVSAQANHYFKFERGPTYGYEAGLSQADKRVGQVQPQIQWAANGSALDVKASVWFMMRDPTSFLDDDANYTYCEGSTALGSYECHTVNLVQTRENGRDDWHHTGPMPLVKGTIAWQIVKDEEANAQTHSMTFVRSETRKDAIQRQLAREHPLY